MTEGTVLFNNYTSAAATEATSKTVHFRGNEKETFTIKATGSAGTYAIDEWVNGAWLQIDTGALVDGDTMIVTIYDVVRKARVRVTTGAVAVLKADATCDGTTYIED